MKYYKDILNVSIPAKFKKLFIALLLIFGMSVSKKASAQYFDPVFDDKAPKEKTVEIYFIKGRVIGINLQELENVTITNICSNETTTTDKKGFYQLNVSKGDTLSFNFPHFSKDVLFIKNPKENLNVILIHKKVEALPPNASRSEVKKAIKEDEDLYDILEKDAKRDGKWTY